MLILSIWVEVEDGIEDKVPHSYWETLPVVLPLQEEGVQIGKWTEFSSVDHDERSRESNWAGRMGRSLRVKVNLPIFKDEKTKDAVTYHLWWWDIAIFCSSGLDDQHLLPYIFQLLQGFTGDLTRSLGEDATLTDVLQTLDEHYSIVMMLNTLRKEFYP